MLLVGDAPLPGEYSFMPLDGLVRHVPDDVVERILLTLDCANASRIGPTRRCSSSRRSWSTSTTTTTTPASGDVNLIVADASSTGEVLARPVPRARHRAHARDRGGAVHRARHGHRPVPVHEHDAEVAAARGRARRGRGGRAPRLPGRVRERPVREAQAARAGARAGAGATRAATRRVLSLRDDFRRSARPSRTRRGSSTCSAPSRAPTWQCSSASRLATAARRTRCRCARRSTSSTSRAIARKSDGGGHRQAAGFSSELSIEEITDSSCARSRRSSSCGGPVVPPRALEPSGDHPRRQARRPDVVRDRRGDASADEGADRPRGHARPLRDRAPALLSGAATRLQPRFVGLPSATRPRSTSPHGRRPATSRASGSTSTTRPPGRSSRQASTPFAARSSSRFPPRRR